MSFPILFLLLSLVLAPFVAATASAQIAADTWAGRRGTVSVQTLLGGSISTYSDDTFEDFVFSSSLQAGLHWRFGKFGLSLLGGIDDRGQMEYSTVDSVTYTSAHVTYWRLGPRLSGCVGQSLTLYLSFNFGQPISAEFRNDSRSLSILDSTEVPPFAEVAFGIQGKLARIWHGILFMGVEYGELSENLFKGWDVFPRDGVNSGDPTRAFRLSIGYEIPFYNLPTDDDEEEGESED